MRKIPIFDISNKEKIVLHVFEWEEGIVHQDNFEKYEREICSFVGCDQSRHLEISRQSSYIFGKKVRTASLSFKMGKQRINSESAYQGSKVLEKEGNQHHLYDVDGETSLRTKSGFKRKEIIGVDFFGHQFEKSSLSDLHHIVYWLGLENSKVDIKKSLEILERNEMFFFTDCYNGIDKNSQSQSFAVYFWRWRRGESVWDFLTENQKEMREIVKNNKYKKTKMIVRGKVQSEALF